MIDTMKEVESNSEIAEICKRRKKMLEDCGLDVNSCLQFLLDYYAQLMKPQVKIKQVNFIQLLSVNTIKDNIGMI